MYNHVTYTTYQQLFYNKIHHINSNYIQILIVSISISIIRLRGITYNFNVPLIPVKMSLH